MKTIKLLLLSLFLTISVSTFAYKNEPNGFRDLQWGTDLSTTKIFLVVESVTKGNDTVYRKKNDNLTIGDAKLDDIEYFSYKSQFCYVALDFSGYLNFDLIKNALITKFGEPRRPNRFLEKYYWIGTKTSIILDYSEITEKGSLSYSSVEISYQERNDDKKKADEAGKDL